MKQHLTQSNMKNKITIQDFLKENYTVIARDKGSIIKQTSGRKAHYLPKSISDNPNFPILLDKQKNVVELYDGFMIIWLNDKS